MRKEERPRLGARKLKKSRSGLSTAAAAAINKSRPRGQRRPSAPIELELHRAACFLTVLIRLCERLGIAAAARALARLEGRAARPLEVIDGDVGRIF